MVCFDLPLCSWYPEHRSEADEALRLFSEMRQLSFLGVERRFLKRFLFVCFVLVEPHLEP